MSNYATVPVVTAVPVKDDGRPETFPNNDEDLARRIQNQQYIDEEFQVQIAPQPPRVIGVQSYYGPKSFLCSVLFILVGLWPCAVIPCFKPCDQQISEGIVVSRPPVNAPRRAVFVTVPPGVVAGQMLVTTTPDGVRVNIVVPPNAPPGTKLQIQC